MTVSPFFIFFSYPSFQVEADSIEILKAQENDASNDSNKENFIACVQAASNQKEPIEKIEDTAMDTG